MVLLLDGTLLDGTKVLTVKEYDKFIQAITESKRAIFEINTITG